MQAVARSSGSMHALFRIGTEYCQINSVRFVAMMAQIAPFSHKDSVFMLSGEVKTETVSRSRVLFGLK